LAARATYRYETFEYSLDFPLDGDTKELRTHYLPVGIKLFCPRGAVVGLSVTYIDQKGEFVSFDPGSPEPVVTEDEDHFWVTDLSFGFRLPRRFGLLNLEVRNLFNTSFHYRDVDDAMIEYYPERTVLGKLTFSF
jgi:hypothetical protein